MSFLKSASFDLEKEIQFDFSEDFNIGIEQAVVDYDAFMFDWHLYKKLKEITKSAEKIDDELIKSTELFESDDEMEIFEKELDMPLLSDVQSANQLSGMWKVDSQIVNNVGEKVSRLAITEYEGLLTQTLNSNRPRFICTNCFITNGGHLHIQPEIKKKQSSVKIEENIMKILHLL
ncbi:3179_t:CDS:2 [Cetraspora pellucida]|uniref:3179_t:CDS:1 n=1 Tax=Cetraspora pellucida TaxID=1433469 RepID=A0ACA9KB28_9GLOM|nr:3179_t:CDS:2 [Cetraspora pellucida]